jgi:glucosamine 6-phosphate synthetase-like amidotransferase/phosphosugar isomerase protein
MAAKLLGVEASCSYPALFNHHEGFAPPSLFRPEEMLLICPAESGRSRGAVDTARAARARGIPVVCTTLNPQGVLARECDVVIRKPTGYEQALPSTKGHLIGLYLLMLCLVDAAAERGTLSPQEYESDLRTLRDLAQSSRQSAAAALAWFEAHRELAMGAGTYQILGYGANFGTAMEAALKFKECHQRPTFAYELEEFLHGPIRIVRENDLIFLLLGEDGPERARMLELYGVLQTLTPGCVLVGDAAAERQPMSLAFPSVGKEFFNAVDLLVPMQVLAYSIGHALGADFTRGLHSEAKAAMHPSYPD